VSGSQGAGVQNNLGVPRQTRFRLETAFKRVAFDATDTYIHMTETSDGTSNVPATFDSGVSSLPERYYIYILLSFKDKGLYIGFTTDLKSRLTTHSKGRNQATILRRPLKLIYYEYFINKADAKAREEFLKSGYSKDQLKQILKRTLKELS